MIDILPYLYFAACIGVIGFQIALMAGAPWGHITQGGQQHGALPVKNRIIAFVSIFILLGMALAVLSAAGLWPHWPRWTAWIALTVQFISMVLNWITPSKAERRLWGPITSVMLITGCSAVLMT